MAAVGFVADPQTNRCLMRPLPGRGIYGRGGKRMLDVVLAATAVLVLSPLIVLVAAIVRWRLGTPVLFWQQRAGLHGRPFALCKFRTMRQATDTAGRLLPDAQRLTPCGQRLRSLSLDELPQLWNILRGHMGLVGPRPLLIRYLPRYSATQARRHDVRPGVTGWAQVNGRNALDWDERFRLDVWYVDHCSLGLDLRILFRTVACVLTRQGISAREHVTMGEFWGNERPADAAPARGDGPPRPGSDQ